VALGAMLNTALIFGAYKAFSGLTSKVTITVSEFEKNNELRQFLNSMEAVGRQAVTVTESTKHHIAEFEPAITNANDWYERTRARVDAKLEDAAKQIDSGARKIRDAVTKPAISTMAFVAGLMKVIETIRDE